jgi:tRNA(Ile)-lysidine synthase
MPNDTLTAQSLTPQLLPLVDSGRWYVALSGGLDSTVLLHLLHSWCQHHAGAPALVAVHINHGLQAEADRWQAHCQALCGHLGVDLLARTIEIDPQGKGLEAAAREGRYRVFEELLAAGDTLFMGHHLDDQVETFFLRLLRGAGLQGLTAMPASRSLGQGALQRPLLSFSREQLAVYARDQRLDYVEDPSNADIGLDRNYLRQQVLPLLATRWPGYRGNVERAIQHLSEAASELQRHHSGHEPTVGDWGDPGLPLAGLSEQREQLQAALRAWLNGLGLAMPDSSMLVEFARQLCEAEPTASPRLDCGSYVLQRYRETIYLLPAPANWQPPEELSLMPERPLMLAGVGELALVPTQGTGLALEPRQTLTIRWRQGGERCQPVGRRQGLAVKQLLQEAAVPPWWRQRLPLLFAGEELLAVADLCLCRSSLLREFPPAGQSNWILAWNRNSLVPEV